MIAALACSQVATAAEEKGPPRHIVLVMADDQGWGQTGYYNHPVLKTPNLDAMAESGLRFDRFYAGAPVCSPTRGSVLTGRANDRIGVKSHGYALRRQEVTIAQMLKDCGYVTGHFGKWHLNAMRGPGVPIFDTDSHDPGEFGFQVWASVTNFFDRDPLLGHQGKIKEHQGDSSEIVIDLALGFISQQEQRGRPSFSVVWYGTPHNPFKASEADKENFQSLNDKSQNHYGELVAMDRSIGTLRRGLRELDIADHTLVWFCSDNGGLPGIEPETVGGLRGNKGTIYEGGLRVPGIIEWPARVKPRVTAFPASVLDIVPTLLEVTPAKHPHHERPLDGISLVPLFDQPIAKRNKPIPFRYQGRGAWVDNDFKILTNEIEGKPFELYNLVADPDESEDLADVMPDRLQAMRHAFLQWNESVKASVAGKDYPEGQVDPSEPQPRFWNTVDAYQPYLEKWKQRWEYGSWLERRRRR